MCFKLLYEFVKEYLCIIMTLPVFKGASFFFPFDVQLLVLQFFCILRVYREEIKGGPNPNEMF